MRGIPLQHVTIHGHEVGYRRAGEGPPLLLIHGMAGSSITWREVLPTLAEHHEVIAPDLLGHGQSAKPLGDYSLGAFASGLRDLLGVLGVPRATVVGHSLGGGVAMQLAYQHPELVDRLVLECAGGLGREVSWLLKSLTLPGAEYIMPLIFPSFMRTRGDEVSKMLMRRGLRAPRIAEMWTAYSRLSQSDNRAAFVRTLRAVIEPGGQSVSAADRLYLAARMPTLIIWGANDPIIPVAHAHSAHAAIDHSRLEIFTDSGHFPHAEQPELYIETLLDFISTTEPAPIDAGAYLELLTGHSTTD